MGVKKANKEKSTDLEKEFLKTYQQHIDEINQEVKLADQAWDEAEEALEKLETHSKAAQKLSEQYGIPFEGIRRNYPVIAGRDTYIPKSFQQWKDLDTKKLNSTIFKDCSEDFGWLLEEFNEDYPGWQNSSLC